MESDLLLREKIPISPIGQFLEKTSPFWTGVKQAKNEVKISDLVTFPKRYFITKVSIIGYEAHAIRHAGLTEKKPGNRVQNVHGSFETKSEIWKAPCDN
jgi:hypothetical protein